MHLLAHNTDSSNTADYTQFSTAGREGGMYQMGSLDIPLLRHYHRKSQKSMESWHDQRYPILKFGIDDQVMKYLSNGLSSKFMISYLVPSSKLLDKMKDLE